MNYIVSVICCLFVFSGMSLSRAANKVDVCDMKHCVDVEIAQTADDRSLGLMFRDHLDNDHGMLFIFEEMDKHSFWMKNMTISLDMLWLDEQGQIVDIKENVPPCKEEQCPSILPDSPARYVLEINAGRAKQLKWSKGNSLTIKGLETP